jgi:hypothetical protein
MQPEKVLSNAVNIPSYLFIFVSFRKLLMFLTSLRFVFGKVLDGVPDMYVLVSSCLGLCVSCSLSAVIRK